jgi:hypothetical protein
MVALAGLSGAPRTLFLSGLIHLQARAHIMEKAMFYLLLCPSRGQVKWQRRIGSHDPSDLFCAISFQTEGAPRKCDRTLFWRPSKPVPRDATIRVRAGGRRCSVRLRPNQSL